MVLLKKCAEVRPPEAPGRPACASLMGDASHATSTDGHNPGQRSLGGHRGCLGRPTLVFRPLHWGRRGTTSRELERAPTARAKRAHLFPAPWSVVSLGSLKQALVGVFMPQKSANKTDQVLFLFLERAGCQALASTALTSAHPGPPDTRQPECQPCPSPSPPAPAAPPRCLHALLLRRVRCKPESKRTPRRARPNLLLPP